MKPNIDVTAGYRMMWPNKNPPNMIFMDKNKESQRAPDILATWEYMPFRDNVFETVFFDPPHKLGRTTGRGHWATPSNKNYYGIDISKTKFRTGVYKGSREFLRVANRLCFKWNDIELMVERVMTLFPKTWEKINHLVIDKGLKTGTLTHWVTFIKSEFFPKCDVK